MSKIINQSIDDIKKKIKKDNQVFWFLIKKNNATLVAKGKNKKEAKKELIKKINAKPEKYIDSRLWRISISLHNEADKKLLIFGDILIMLENFTVNEYADNLKIRRNTEVGKTGQIWFTKKWLEMNTWKKSYITRIIKKTLASKKKILKIKDPNLYDITYR